jgi:prepilin-type N-terminal cleavage/methylation domain-containing protein
MPRRRRAGFTAVELMIVMVALLVIAGIVIPQFDSVLDEAMESRMLANLHDLHVAVERYRIDHRGQIPNSAKQLLEVTNCLGNAGEGAAYRYGPYLPEIPVNPINNSAAITLTTDDAPDVAKSSGWLLNSTTGHLWGGTASP